MGTDVSRRLEIQRHGSPRGHFGLDLNGPFSGRGYLAAGWAEPGVALQSSVRLLFAPQEPLVAPRGRHHTQCWRLV